MGGSHITYTPRADATPEAELSTLAAVYRSLILESEGQEKGGPETAPDARKEINGSGKPIILE